MSKPEMIDRQKNAEDSSFVKKLNHCREIWFQKRNAALLRQLMDKNFRSVYEFAGASGLLAEMFLCEHPKTRYLLSDYSPEACRLARGNLARFPEASVEMIDMRADLDNIPWDDFDLVMSTSMEHLPKGLDIEIIKRIRKGTQVLFCLAAFGGGTHPHYYPSKDYVIERFSPFIEIKQLLVMLFPSGFTCVYGDELLATENFVILLDGEKSY